MDTGAAVDTILVLDPRFRLKTVMSLRLATIALFFIFAALTISAQQTVPSTPTQPSSPVTIAGCLMGMNGAFFLTNAQGERFVLKGDHDTLFSYNGMQVQVTGKPKYIKKNSGDPKPGPFTVQNIQKVAQVCQ
jgi:hypothetical protein